MSDQNANADARRPAVPRSGGLLAFAAAAIMLLVLGVVAFSRLAPPVRHTDIMSANLQEAQDMVKAATRSARATTRLIAETTRITLNKADPTRFIPSNLPVSIGFVPNEAGNGGKVTIDFGEGLVIDYITISGKVTTEFAVVPDPSTSTITITITMRFNEAKIVDDYPDSDFYGTLQLDGTVTATTVLKGLTATCTFTGPMQITVNTKNATIYTGGVTGVLDGTQGTIVFNGSSRITFEQLLEPPLPNLDLGQWRVTFIDLLFRLGTGSIDSGRVKVEQLATVLPLVTVYKFLYPNGGDKTIYPPPGGYTESFTLEPPELRPPPAPTAFTATAVSATQVDLRWTNASASKDDLTRDFNIERRLVGDSFRLIREVRANTTSLSDTNGTSTSVTLPPLEKSTAYEYRIVAGNHRGKSPPSLATTITPPAPLTIQSMTPPRVAGVSGS